MTATRLNPQASLYETTIENADLEDALEKRQKAKEKRAAASKAFRDADEEAKGLIAKADLGLDATVRVGRFTLTEKHTPARSVSFDTAAGKRLQIGLIDELP